MPSFCLSKKLVKNNEYGTRAAERNISVELYNECADTEYFIALKANQYVDLNFFCFFLLRKQDTLCVKVYCA